MAEVKLLGVSLSPFSRRVEWALKIKGIEYEFVEEDLENKSPLLLESNPVHKKIPVLLHKGKPICESMIIVEYIDETFEGPSILPKDPYHRAIARFWAKFFDETCMPVLGKAMFGSGEESDKAKEECGRLIKILENELKDKKFFVGDKFGFADMAGNLMAYWMGIVEEASGNVFVTSEKFPIFCAWRDEYINCSPVKEYFPPRDAILAHFKARFQAAAASK
ncbi:unnamed protein product [Withania somnifera]